ncbi:MAG: DUF1848 domain-containing protein [Pseudomonadota bacterium]|nr:DUF1848 domain-containing protein [Pseudomonadota bacterium]
MIISASYRTDIPAFYGEWFMHRLKLGQCNVVNPWNGKPYSVSLQSADVDGFVFWTRNLAPFAKHLGRISKHAPFCVQYTITGYPRTLDRSVIQPDQAIADIADLARHFGPKVAVWRYDPIVISSLTPESWHVENFRSLARPLEGLVDEVTISLLQPYRKTLRNLDRVARDEEFSWQAKSPESLSETTALLADIAAEHGISLTVCSQNGLIAGSARASACIDATRLSDIAGHKIIAKIKGNRPDCLCYAARDIGAYDTCPHGCVYCYAVSDPQLAKRNFKASRSDEDKH